MQLAVAAAVQAYRTGPRGRSWHRSWEQGREQERRQVQAQELELGVEQEQLPT